MTAALVDGIEALMAVDRWGTVSEAAVRLRLTQSAVSKRLQALGRAVGYPVVAPEGRLVRITPRGRALLARGAPLVAGLRDLALPEAEDGALAGVHHLSLALADSVAASWGPAAVAAARVPGLVVELHAHRSALLVEYVRSGRYQAGLCTELDSAADLIALPVVREPMVLVNAGLGDHPTDEAALITIEPASATWRAVGAALLRRHPALAARRIVGVETFGAALQMVRAGFGDGVVPMGCALDPPLPDGAWTELAVARPIALIARKTVALLPSFAAFHAALAATAAARLGCAG